MSPRGDLWYLLNMKNNCFSEPFTGHCQSATEELVKWHASFLTQHLKTYEDTEKKHQTHHASKEKPLYQSVLGQESQNLINRVGLVGGVWGKLSING